MNENKYFCALIQLSFRIYVLFGLLIFSNSRRRFELVSLTRASAVDFEAGCGDSFKARPGFSLTSEAVYIFEHVSGSNNKAMMQLIACFKAAIKFGKKWINKRLHDR